MLSPADERADGRLARGARARRAVVDALLDLLQEGDLRPTAPRIAERAGVSPRTVFHHFADLERLFAAAAERQMTRLGALARPLRTDGPLEERLDAFVRQRGRLLEAVTPVRRAAVRMEPFSRAVAEQLARTRALGAAEVRRVFAPELAATAPAARRDVEAALAAAASWPTWEALRAHQQLSAARAERVLRRTLAALLRAA